MSVQMSLHRIISEIKHLEEKLVTINATQFLAVATTGSNEVNGLTKETVRKTSQSLYDGYVAAIKNLATLKAARNKANATTQVIIGSVTMTIDEALAQKAILSYKQQLVNMIQGQFTQANNQVSQIDKQLDSQITATIQELFKGRTATQEEIDMIKKNYDGKRAEVVSYTSLKDNIDKLSKDLEQFKLEVDYVLSEANATTKVEVELV